MQNDRLARLRQQMTELNVDTFMITQPENRRYVSAFTGSNGVVFITQSESKLATDFRYCEQVKQQCPGFTLVEVKGGFQAALAPILGGLGARRVAFESDDVTYDLYEILAAGLPAGVELVPTKDVTRGLRAVKEPVEIEALERAIKWTDQAIATLRAMLRPGMTEKEIAWKLEQEMHESGGAAWTFGLIVAAGPACAMPHARPTDRPVEAGEPIVIDMGCTADGYFSDMTRTLIIGEPDARFREIYDIVLRAQQTATAGIVPGMYGKAAHSLAAQVIERAGYGQAFGHGLGHGVGLAIHELPVLGPTSEQVLKPGHVFSVEPGIYLPEWGGVRIEDLALLGENGALTLTRASKDPVVPLR